VKKAIGKLKTKTMVYCEVCNCRYKRVSSVTVYSTKRAVVEEAKAQLAKKAKKVYICKICKTIKKK
jgi:thioredoxin reductase